jgi:deoxyribonuclease-4
MSIAGGFLESLDLARNLRSTALQIFSASPRMWAGPGHKVHPGVAEEFRRRRAELGLSPLVIHANYLINLAAPDDRTLALSMAGFQGELERASALGADFLVVHPGSRRDSTIETAVDRISGSMARSARGLNLGPLRILVEITAGQGSAVGSRIEELRAILDACSKLPVGVCLDTAHLFAAGYPIHTQDGLDGTMKAIEREIGMDRVPVVHVNDSKALFGSRVDRHEHLGRGQIGLEAMGRVVNHPALAGRAFILETPIDEPGDDWRNVRALWRLAGVEWEQPLGHAAPADGFRPPRKEARSRQTQTR